MSDIAVRLRLGASSTDQHDLVVSAEMPIGDLITSWKKDYRLSETDRQGEMIRYVLYYDRGAEQVRADLERSLRQLRVPAFVVLYLGDERQLWWQNGPASSTTSGSAKPGTAPLNPLRNGPRPTPASASSGLPTAQPAPPIATAAVIPCSIELAPGCVRSITASGVVINRDYLLRELPQSICTRERALGMVGIASRLMAVSRSETGHCSLIWRQSWYLIAHSPVYLGATRYNHNEAVPIDQTMTILLGRNGWPITIRLHSTGITR